MNRLAHVIPALIYLSGLAALLLSDVLVTKFLAASSVSTWAEIRSLVGIASVLCLVGLDQSFIRSPQSSRRLLKLLAIQIPAVACLIAAAAYAFGLNSHWLAVTCLCTGAAGSLALFQFYRTHERKADSQFAQQAWKYLAFLVVLYAAVSGVEIELTVVLAWAMMLALGASAARGFIHRAPPDERPEKLPVLYSIGARFLFTSLLLSLAIYAEQLVVSSMGTHVESAYYFTHATYFLFPISVVNGYIAFNIGPWVRRHRHRFVKLLKTKAMVVVSSTIAYAAVTHALGWAAWLTLLPGDRLPDALLQALIFLSCVMRTFYVLPAGYLGVFGAASEHDRLIGLQLLALSCSAVLFGILYQVFSLSILHATAAASLLNWMLRTSASFFMVKQIEHRLVT